MKRQQLTKNNQHDRQSETTCCAKPTSATSESVDLFGHLQRTMGNEAIGHLIQAKLQISQPNDVHEQEADRVAEQVMRMPDPSPAPNALAIHELPAAPLQRQCDQCKEEEPQSPGPNEEDVGMAVDTDLPLLPSPSKAPEEELPLPLSPTTCAPGIQTERMHAAERNVQAREAPQSAIGASTSPSGGRPLEVTERSFFEPRFGYSFDQVRIHSDEHAAVSARAFNALAYTVGNDIVFGAGNYVPGSSTARRLLAHELTHVVQQNMAHTPTQSPGTANPSIDVRAEATGIVQRWSADGPAPKTTNTIVCDGAGSIRVQIGTANDAGSLPCMVDCLTKHEESHKSDALAANAEVCKGSADGNQVNFGPGEQKPSEIKASQVEIDCLNAKLPTATATCKPSIEARIKQMITYRDSFK